MRQTVLAALAAVGLLAGAAGSARAGTLNVSFAGGGVSGTLHLTYGAATDATYPNAYEVSNITGVFSDASLGIVDAKVLKAVPLNRQPPEPSNLLAPNDFSHFDVASGLSHGFLTYDNLYWPGGSPQTATDYPFGGGILDIYGLLFDIGGGRVVDLWSNGSIFGAPVDYGVAVATAAQALDYVEGGLSVTVPEPGSFWLLGGALLGVLAACRMRPGRRLA